MKIFTRLSLALLMAVGVPAISRADTTYSWQNFVGLPNGLGIVDGTGSAALFGTPEGVAVDSANNLYVADSASHTIRKVTPAGVVTTLVGLAGHPGIVDGTGSAARFRNPFGLAVDSAGNVYVADEGNHSIRKVTPAGLVTTLAGNASILGTNGLPAGGYADGTGSAARFNAPLGVAVDGAGNVFVTDWRNDVIRKVTPGGVVTTLAGNAYVAGAFADGPGAAARFYRPRGLAIDSAGNLVVGDEYNYVIRKVTPGGVVTTIAGTHGSHGSADGTGSSAQFFRPMGVAVDGFGNILVADGTNNTIRKVTAAGVVTTIGGSAGTAGSADGTGPAARFNGPRDVAVDSEGNVYVADALNFRISRGHTLLTITNSPPAGLVGEVYQHTFGADGGHLPYNWSVVSNNLPAGLTLDPNGTVTGTPTVKGITSFRIRVIDARDQVAEVEVYIEVDQSVVFGPHDSLTLSESQKDSLVCASDGAGGVYCDTSTSGSTTIKATLFSAHPIDPATLDKNTSVDIVVGGWFFSAALGDAVKYVRGAKSATWLLQHEECNDNGDCKTKTHGQVAIKFSNKGVALAIAFTTGTTKNGDSLESAALTSDYQDAAGPIADTAEADLQVDLYTTSVQLAITGRTQIKTITKSDTDYDLSSVTLTGAAIRPH